MGSTNLFGVAVANLAGHPTPDPNLTYTRQYNPHGFSFSDVHASLVLPFSSSDKSASVDLPALTLVSFSTHRDTYPVVGTGGRGIRGMTKGYQTVAGTLGFDSMGSGAFAEAIHAYANWRGYAGSLANLSADQLPPFTVHLLLMKNAQENSDYQETVGRISLFGVSIIDFSGNVSVRDVLMTEVYSFIAGGINYLLPDDALIAFENNVSKRTNLNYLALGASAQNVNALTMPPVASPLDDANGLNLLQGILGGGTITNMIPTELTGNTKSIITDDRFANIGILKEAP